MNCTPQALLQAAACYRCIPKKVMQASMISLLCEWANHITPTDQLIWEPQTEVMKWTDSGGTHSGDLATFQSTADIPTVTSFDCNHKPITSITGLSSLPALQIFAGSDVWTVTSLDFTGCNNIQSIGLDLGGTLTSLIVNNLPSLTTLLCPLNQLVSLDVSGDTALTTLDCSFNAPMTSLTLTGCTSLSYLDCNSCNITGALDASGLSSLATFNCSSNASLTTLTLTGCTALATLTAYSCDITGSFDLSICPSLASVDLDQNVNLTGIVLTGLASLNSLRCSGCNITGILDLSPSTSLTFVGCYNNTNLTSIVLTGLTSLDHLACYACGISGVFNVTQASALTFLDCGEHPLMTSVTLTGLASLATLYVNDSGLTSLDVSPCIALVDFIGSANSLNQAAVDSVLCAVDANGQINGSLDIGSNTAPSAAGLVCSANLDPGKGWTVIHD